MTREWGGTRVCVCVCVCVCVAGGIPFALWRGRQDSPSSQSCEFGEVCTWALGGGGPGQGGEEKVRLHVRVCVCVCVCTQFLSTSRARGIEWGAVPRYGRGEGGQRRGVKRPLCSGSCGLGVG